MQTKTVSLIEATINTCSGFVISVLVGMVIYPWFGVRFNVVELSGITAIFTVLSIARGYLVRRIFNAFHVRERLLG